MTNKDDFISTVSHEMRTPLTSIRGFSQTLLASWDKIDDNSKKKFIEIIEQQSNRLINLVENILSVTKLPDEKIAFQKVSVNKETDTAIQLIKQKYSDYKFEFVSPKTELFISADSDKLQQILINILENACKYSDTGSIVKIKAEDNNSNVLISVQDNGVGIDEKYKDSIFQKFSRIDNPLTRKTQGSGLGLFITKTLVEKMNGHIYFKSSHDGTTFFIEFPQYNIEDHIKCSATY